MNMPNYYGYYPQPYPSYQNNQNQQIQSGGFMVVPSEDIVSSYPIEPGKCVTFKIDGKPLVLEKSRGFSQFEQPRIDRYRLVKEEAAEETQTTFSEPQQREGNNPVYEELKAKIEALEEEIADIKRKAKPATKRKEIADDPE